MAREKPVLDQSRDLDGRGLNRLMSLYEVPEWVKSASSAEICGDQIPGHCYADPRGLLYPTHTKAATWTSLAFFLDNEPGYREGEAAAILERLLKTASFQGIRASCDSLV